MTFTQFKLPFNFTNTNKCPCPILISIALLYHQRIIALENPLTPMKFISYIKNRLHQLALSALLFLCISFNSQAQQMGISVATTQNGNEVIADFLVYNFTDIISFQYSMNWDASQLEFVEMVDYNLQDLNGSNFGLFNASQGNITTSWFDSALNGVTAPPCFSIYSMRFNLIGTEIPAFTFGNSPTVIEIIQFDGVNDIQLDLIQTGTCDNIGTLNGAVFFDEDNSCSFDPGETGLENWIVQIVGNGFTFYQNTDANGSVNLFLPEGNYDLTLFLPSNGFWTACSTTQNIEIVKDENTDAFFPAQALVNCPALSVDISAPFLRRCFSSTYYIDYCNEGTDLAADAYIEVDFDDDLEVVTSSTPWTSVDGNTYTFPVGNLELGDCGSFTVEVIVSCESELGATHCSQATIFPNTPCTQPDPLWDGSSLQVDGECDGDEVLFTITNVGDNMQNATEFIIIEDDMMALPPTPVDLASLESLEVSRPANGTSYRIQVTQSEYHPGMSMPSVSVEGCINDSGEASVGFAGQFPEDDLDPWVDIDCQANIGSWDPNDKIGYPLGYGDEHFIEPGTEIEYRIRFQNTGTDVAFNVSIIDTLSPFLDPSTVRVGTSSHDYEFEMSGEGILKFDFPWIMLPDSSTNQIGSNGFVKFKVKPRAGIALGTVIENSAAIYFDFNEPVITNTYFHTVDENFIMQQEPNAVGNIPLSDVQVSLTPNPSAVGSRPLLLMKSGENKALQFQIFDLEGQTIFQSENTISEGSSLITLPIQMQAGTYLLQVTDEQLQGTTLKMLVR